METAQFRGAMAALDAAAANEYLSDREKHLIGLAVTATRGCTHCTGGRIRKAIDSGVPRDTVIAAVDLAAAVNAGVTVRTAIAGAEQAGAGSGCTDVGCVGAEAAGQR
jgi:alkylhydroperoxidase/carboxymuconolactone decarboxylase family protein YurZ